MDFHEEIDRPFVLVVRSSVPGPRRQSRVGIEYDGALADCEAGLDKPIKS